MLLVTYRCSFLVAESYCLQFVQHLLNCASSHDLKYTDYIIFNMSLYFFIEHQVTKVNFKQNKLVQQKWSKQSSFLLRCMAIRNCDRDRPEHLKAAFAKTIVKHKGPTGAAPPPAFMLMPRSPNQPVAVNLSGYQHLHYGLTRGPVPSQIFSVFKGCISGSIRLQTKQKNTFLSLQNSRVVLESTLRAKSCASTHFKCFK